MHLLFDIFQGVGIATAVGIRPFLPALAVGALAAGSVAIHFGGTDYSFLQQAPFLIVMVLGAIAFALVDRRLRDRDSARRPVALTLAACAVVVGALLFAGALARGHYVAWPGLVGGVACALLGAAATAPLLRRVRGRLDRDAASALPVIVEGAAVGLAVLSVLAPPLGPIAALLLVWLLLASRRREGQKYAGLRILR